MRKSDSENLKAMQDFLDKIGIELIFTELNEETFLPGIKIDRGRLLVDRSRMLYPGDLFHEAGHIALLAPEERLQRSGDMSGQENQEAVEMAAIAWSFAASLEAGIDPAVVLHNEGYKGGGGSILENFKNGQYFGVPILQWLKMTDHTAEGNIDDRFVYPKMRRWLREVS